MTDHTRPKDEKIWSKMPLPDRKKALAKTGSWRDDANKKLSHMGGSQQDVMTGAVRAIAKDKHNARHGIKHKVAIKMGNPKNPWNDSANKHRHTDPDAD